MSYCSITLMDPILSLIIFYFEFPRFLNRGLSVLASPDARAEFDFMFHYENIKNCFPSQIVSHSDETDAS